jgi:hypothetical protein
MWCFAGALSVLLLIALPALGQDNGRAPLVGVLLVNTATDPAPVAPLLRRALGGLGYVEGRNLCLDFRFAEGHAELLRRSPKSWPLKTPM